MQHPDICIAGAGIMGLSIALELVRRGASVTVFDRGAPLSEASVAAAGMLAAADPHNPPALGPLAGLSLDLYGAFLDHLASLSDIRVPFQTELTLQQVQLSSPGSLSPADLNAFLPPNQLAGRAFSLLDEHSIDPRQLASAVLAAAGNTGIRLESDVEVLGVENNAGSLTVTTSAGPRATGYFIDCTGAWSLTSLASVTPCKGQLLSVALPRSISLSIVLRADDVYIVPRTRGDRAGLAIIGATLEDTGFDKSVHTADIRRLLRTAADLLPGLEEAPLIEQWSGLRPATPDQLPLIGPHSGGANHLVATGHFRNGILLAPATAHLIAQIVFGETASIDLAPFSPGRFAATTIP